MTLTFYLKITDQDNLNFISNKCHGSVVLGLRVVLRIYKRPIGVSIQEKSVLLDWHSCLHSTVSPYWCRCKAHLSSNKLRMDMGKRAAEGGGWTSVVIIRNAGKSIELRKSFNWPLSTSIMVQKDQSVRQGGQRWPELDQRYGNRSWNRDYYYSSSFEILSGNCIANKLWIWWQLRRTRVNEKGWPMFQICEDE